jgi:hypothetical protein
LPFGHRHSGKRSEDRLADFTQGDSERGHNSVFGARRGTQPDTL